ncbi:MAG: hypothetical protein KJ709_06250 [Nanoarchaeota archaeon]|nr:hypothetical protein [Nanoarchaeota archaeon]
MATDLGERLLKEASGIYYGGRAENSMSADDTLFGVEDQQALDLCKPRKNLSRLSMTYQRLPKRVREAVRNPDNSDLFTGGHTLFFFHYPLDKKRFIKNKGRSLVDLGNFSLSVSQDDIGQILGEPFQAISCIYANFMGQTLYVGDEALMQEVTDHLKGGFPGVLEIASQLIREDLAIGEVGSFRELVIYDALQEPRLVHHRR